MKEVISSRRVKELFDQFESPDLEQIIQLLLEVYRSRSDNVPAVQCVHPVTYG